MTAEERIRVRLTELEQEQETDIAEANKRVFARGVVIEELKKLLRKPEAKPQVDKEANRWII